MVDEVATSSEEERAEDVAAVEKNGTLSEEVTPEKKNATVEKTNSSSSKKPLQFSSSKTSFFTWLWRAANPFYSAKSARKLEPKPRRSLWAIIFGRSTPRHILVKPEAAPPQKKSWFGRRKDVPLVAAAQTKNASNASFSQFYEEQQRRTKKKKAADKTKKRNETSVSSQEEKGAVFRDFSSKAGDEDSDEAVDRALLASALEAARKERDAALETAMKTEALVDELRDTVEREKATVKELKVQISDSDAEVENFRRNYALRDSQLDDVLTSAKQEVDHLVSFESLAFYIR